MLYLLQPEVRVVRQVDLDGAAHLMLPPGVRHLDEATAVFEAMLEGWECQQRSRFLRAETIAPLVVDRAIQLSERPAGSVKCCRTAT